MHVDEDDNIADNDVENHEVQQDDIEETLLRMVRLRILMLGWMRMTMRMKTRMMLWRCRESEERKSRAADNQEPQNIPKKK